MSDLSNQAQKLLGRFSKTVDVMKSAYSKRNKMMFVWADDLYAVEAVMSFLETIRDAPAPSGQKKADIEILQQKLEFAEWEWNRATEGMKERDAKIALLESRVERAAKCLRSYGEPLADELWPISSTDSKEGAA